MAKQINSNKNYYLGGINIYLNDGMERVITGRHDDQRPQPLVIYGMRYPSMTLQQQMGDAFLLCPSRE